MTVALKQENIITEIGPGDLFHSWFSTVATKLENGNWGIKYPITMNILYQGKLTLTDANEALIELNEIREKFKDLSPDDLIWDTENPNKKPPKEIEFNKNAKNLANYYKTINGLNLTDEMVENVESIIEYGGTIDVISYHGQPPIF